MELPFEKTSDNVQEYGKYVAMQQKLIADLYLHFSYANKSLSELNNLEKNPVIMGYKPDLLDPKQSLYYRDYAQKHRTIRGNTKVIINQAESHFSQIIKRFERPNPLLVRYIESVNKYVHLWDEIKDLTENVKEHEIFLSIVRHIKAGKPIELKESSENN